MFSLFVVSFERLCFCGEEDTLPTVSRFSEETMAGLGGTDNGGIQPLLPNTTHCDGQPQKV